MLVKRKGAEPACEGQCPHNKPHEFSHGISYCGGVCLINVKVTKGLDGKGKPTLLAKGAKYFGECAPA